MRGDVRSSDRLPSPHEAARPWLATYPPGVPATYDYPDVAFPRLLDDAARDFPRQAATSFGGATLSYAALLDQADRLASALAGMGVGPGTRVAIVLPNVPAFPVALFAVLRVGAVAVPIAPDTSPPRLHERLADSDAVAVVCTDDDAAKFANARARLPALRHVIVTAEDDWRRFPRAHPSRLRRRHMQPGAAVAPLPALLRTADPLAVQAPVGAQDLAVLAYPRGEGAGALLTHGNLVAAAFQVRLWVADAQAGAERVLSTLPLATPVGLVLGLAVPVLAAATVVLEARPAAPRTARLIERRTPTLMATTPSLLRAMLEDPDALRHDLTSLRACIVTGAALPEDTATRFEAVSAARVREAYGAGPAAAVTHANPIYGRAARGRAGVPLPDTVAVVVDPAAPERQVGPGTPGLLAVSGPQVAPARVDGSPLLRDGWLLTDDLAVVDEQGLVTVVGRLPGLT